MMEKWVGRCTYHNTSLSLLRVLGRQELAFFGGFEKKARKMERKENTHVCLRLVCMMIKKTRLLLARDATSCGGRILFGKEGCGFFRQTGRILQIVGDA